MKNRGEDAHKKSNRCISTEIFLNILVVTINKNPALFLKSAGSLSIKNYLFIYITSFTSFTVREISGKAAATRFGA